jgi:hypothetical protein
MQVVLRYKWLKATSADVDIIRQLIVDNPRTSRRALSFAVCEEPNWKHENSAPRDGVCRGLLLELRRAVHIELPPARPFQRVDT